jgi:hypothetical protein
MDVVGNATTGSTTVSVDSKAPTVTVTCPAKPVFKGAVASAPWTASDGESGLATPATGSTALDTSTVGPHTATARATDKVGHTGTGSCVYTVIFRFTGFFSPVNNPSTINVVQPGSAVPVKFSLAGDQGLAIFAAGYPRAVNQSCSTGIATDIVEETVTAGSSLLSYDPGSQQYVYVWKTPSTWPSGSCRQLQVRLVDGTNHVANFKAK